MSDYYEGINGLNNGANDANADMDSDGMTTPEEFKAGTTTNLKVTATPNDAASLSLSWPSISGMAYAIEGAPTLAGAWTRETGVENLLATGPLTLFPLPFALFTNRFFRVLALPGW